MTNQLVKKYQEGIDYVRTQMTPDMQRMYADVDYKKTLAQMTDVETALVAGKEVSKEKVDMIISRLNLLLKLEEWSLNPPEHMLDKLNPIRRMIKTAYEHTLEIKTMIEEDIQEKFILSDGKYSLKEEHRFVEK